MAPKDNFIHEFERLAFERADLMARIADQNVAPAMLTADDVKNTVDGLVMRMSRIAEKAEAAIDAVADKRLEIAAPLRRFMLDRGITRPARKTNRIKTALILQGCFAVETTATAGLLAGDGVMGIVPALLTGTIFSATNIALAAATGYFGLRGATYRLDAPQPERWDKRIRRVSAIGSAGAVAAMAGLHFAAARVRVTGEHAGIWDWEKVSLAGTFSDYYAIALLAIGALSSLLAMREGWGHIADPIWGYTEITTASENQINDALDQAFDDGVSQLDTAMDSAIDHVETASADYGERREGYRSEVQTLREDVGRFNCDIDVTITKLKAARDTDNTHRQYLVGLGRKADAASLDLAALRQLRIDEALIPSDELPPADPGNPTETLETNFEDAIGKLQAAHMTARSFITLPFYTQETR
jgi:hypothetical protein